MSKLTAASEGLLKTIFGNENGRAWIAWKGDMGGCTAALLGADMPPAGVDTYFSVALMVPGATGRTNAQAERVYALVIDDVGTKIDMAAFRMFAPEPTWELETSPGNYQMGYAIAGGCSVEDYAGLRAAMKGHPVWGRSDGVDAVHLFRLPQGVNSKHSVYFPIGNGWKNVRAVRSFSELLLGMAGPPAAAGAGAAGEGSADVIEAPGLLVGLLLLIPNDRPDRERWVSVAHAVWGASQGAEQAVFSAWAAGWTAGADDPAANDRLWESIHASTIGRSWLIREARAVDPAGVDGWMQNEAAFVFDDGVQHPAAAGAPAGAPITPFHRTVAWEVERGAGAGLRFNHDSGAWHVFDGVVWVPRPASVKEGFLRAMAWVNRNIVGMTAAEVKAVSRADFYSGVETILRQRLAIRQAAFDSDPWLLGTPAGVVDLKTGLLGPASAADFISKQTAAGPAAVALCPRWRKFIGEICKGDLASTTFLQQWAGYCLTGDTREQVFLFLYGPGGNGKSVLMDTLGRLLGDYFVKPVADLYFAKGGTRHMQEVAMLAGARLITVSEVPPNASWDEGKLKDHTGGGKVTANFMRQNSFSFVPQFKITALGNHQPTFPGGMNAAIKRRFRMMLLDYVPVVVDRGLMEGLWAEREEILRWCLDGLTDPGRGWLSTGLIVPTAVQDATDEFIHDQDVFGLWLEARVEKQRGKRTNTSDLFNDWTEFRHANGAPAVATNPTAFSVEMVKRGFNRVRTMSVRGFDGIALKSKAKSAF